MELADFIVKAKKNTYASGRKSVKLGDGFEEFVFEEENYRYRDRYYVENSKSFGGNEVVCFKGKIIWMMNYYGFVISDEIGSKEVYFFLKKAMGFVDKQGPFRGPLNFEEGNFKYVDESEGDLNNFKGIEKIFFNDNEVYRLEYHGGIL